MASFDTDKGGRHNDILRKGCWLCGQNWVLFSGVHFAENSLLPLHFAAASKWDQPSLHCVLCKGSKVYDTHCTLWWEETTLDEHIHAHTHTHTHPCTCADTHTVWTNPPAHTHDLDEHTHSLDETYPHRHAHVCARTHTHTHTPTLLLHTLTLSFSFLSVTDGQ